MDYILTTLLSYLLLYKYAAIFVVVLVSGFLLPLPSNTLLMAAGAFASSSGCSCGVAFTGSVCARRSATAVGPKAAPKRKKK